MPISGGKLLSIFPEASSTIRFLSLTMSGEIVVIELWLTKSEVKKEYRNTSTASVLSPKPPMSIFVHDCSSSPLPSFALAFAALAVNGPPPLLASSPPSLRSSSFALPLTPFFGVSRCSPLAAMEGSLVGSVMVIAAFVALRAANAAARAW
jgi:hypothetical protein